jgi:hypothetical protein
MIDFLLALPLWTAPLALTALTWGLVLCVPTSGATSVADLGPMFEALSRLFFAIVLTLVYWLVFFAIT